MHWDTENAGSTIATTLEVDRFVNDVSRRASRLATQYFRCGLARIFISLNLNSVSFVLVALSRLRQIGDGQIRSNVLINRETFLSFFCQLFHEFFADIFTFLSNLNVNIFLQVTNASVINETIICPRLHRCHPNAALLYNLSGRNSSNSYTSLYYLKYV